jgi:hypothetical protein
MTRPHSRSALFLGGAPAGPPPPQPEAQTGERRQGRAGGGDNERRPAAVGRARRALWRAGAAWQPLGAPQPGPQLPAVAVRGGRSAGPQPGVVAPPRAWDPGQSVDEPTCAESSGRFPLYSGAARSVSASREVEFVVTAPKNPMPRGEPKYRAGCGSGSRSPPAL